MIDTIKKDGRMNDYQKEQYETLVSVREYINRLTASEIARLEKQAEPYFDFRRRVKCFLNDHFNAVCTRSCYQNQLSACCSRDGIITFFADVVINTLTSSKEQLDSLCSRLRKAHTGQKCIYLGDDGCTWRMKPIVCEFFLCQASTTQVFKNAPQAQKQWDAFKIEKKRYTWPDQPVLFDMLESYFIKAGCSSSLMYMHNSPGLLRVKQKANLSG
jgi:hypothetical protein